MSLTARPTSIDGAQRALAEASGASQSVRILGAGTAADWGAPVTAELELHTGGLDRVLEHNSGDLTAVLEGGASVARAQETFAAAGQMLALDPWLGPAGEATIGGVLATGDSGPLAHRYGTGRDLVLGMTVVLSDGTAARSGGKVIKNVAGYDLAKLFCGSFGTLGLIAAVNVRLHPLPAATATAVGETSDPAVLARAARGLAAAPLELEAFDLAWDDQGGRLLARCGGARSGQRAERALELMRELGMGSGEVLGEDEPLWEAQRAAQRSRDAVVVRVAAQPSSLAEVLAAARAFAARVVGRAASGLSFITVAPEAASSLLVALPPRARWVLRDAPEAMRGRIDPWGPTAPAPAIELMRRVKARFDPTQTCNPGLFVSGI